MNNHKSFPWLFVLVGLITFIVGVCGYVEWQPWNNNVAVESKVSGVANIFNAIYATAMLFAFGGDAHSEAPWVVDVARVFAIILLWSGIAWAFWGRLAQLYKVGRARRWRNHVVVIGLGERGLAFAKSALNNCALKLHGGQQLSGKVLVIDAQASPLSGASLPAEKAVVVTGDARSAELLKLYRVYNAAVIVVVTADDESNIAIKNALSEVIESTIERQWFSLAALKCFLLRMLLFLKKDGVEAATDCDKTVERCRVYVQIDSDEIRLAAREHFNQSVSKATEKPRFGDSTKNTEKEKIKHHNSFVFDSFSGRDLVATTWFSDAKLHQLAALRCEKRLHLVVVGINAMTIEIIRVFVQLAPSPNFAVPVISLLLDDLEPDAHGGLQSRQLQRLKAQLPGFDHLLLKLNLYSWRGLEQAVSEDLLIKVEQECPVSAVVVSFDNDHISSTLALRLRQASKQYDHWRAPIYVHLRHQAGFQYVVKNAKKTKRLSDVLESFGAIEACCTLDYLVDGREELARSIHENYRKWGHFKGPGAHENTEEFDALKDTYKSANRRQAEHIPVKLASIGFEQIQPLPKGDEPTQSENVAETQKYLCVQGTDFDLTDKSLELLAEAEHDSWCNERLIEGWQGSDKRDDTRKLHNTLIPYKALEGVRDKKGVLYTDYDKDAVRFACAVRDTSVNADEDKTLGLWEVSTKPTWRRVVRIALVGHNNLGAENAQLVKAGFERHLQVLSKIYSGCLLRFFTPLAPGSDLIMAELVAEAAKNPSTVEMRLVVVESLPREFVIDDYRSHFAECFPSLAEHWQKKRVWDAPADDELTCGREKLKKEIDCIAEKTDCTDWVLEIGETGKLPEHWEVTTYREAAYVRAATWLVDHCDVLVVARDKDPERDSPAGANGTYLQWQNKPAPTEGSVVDKFAPMVFCEDSEDRKSCQDCKGKDDSKVVCRGKKQSVYEIVLKPATQ